MSVVCFQLSLASRQMLLLETLKVKQSLLDPVPAALKLPVAVSCYWVQHAEATLKLHHLQALLLGMLLGHLLKSKLPDGFLDKLAFVIFAVFGFTTMAEGASLLGVQSPLHWAIAAGVAVIFTLLCVWTVRRNGSTKTENLPE